MKPGPFLCQKCKIRFEDKLEIDFELDENALDFKVPCFILNPLVENAIKHGFQTSPKPLQIKISAKDIDSKLILEVLNTGNLENSNNGTKIGLKNVRERLEKLFPEKSSFELKENGKFVSAKIEIDKN